MSRRSKTFEAEVEVNLSEWDDEDLKAELEERKVPFYEAHTLSKRNIERLYYATRPGVDVAAGLMEDVHQFLADVYGRAT